MLEKHVSHSNIKFCHGQYVTTGDKLIRHVSTGNNIFRWNFAERLGKSQMLDSLIPARIVLPEYDFLPLSMDVSGDISTQNWNFSIFGNTFTNSYSEHSQQISEQHVTWHEQRDMSNTDETIEATCWPRRHFVRTCCSLMLYCFQLRETFWEQHSYRKDMLELTFAPMLICSGPSGLKTLDMNSTIIIINRIDAKNILKTKLSAFAYSRIVWTRRLISVCQAARHRSSKVPDHSIWAAGYHPSRGSQMNRKAMMLRVRICGKWSRRSTKHSSEERQGWSCERMSGCDGSQTESCSLIWRQTASGPAVYDYMKVELKNKKYSFYNRHYFKISM